MKILGIKIFLPHFCRTFCQKMFYEWTFLSRLVEELLIELNPHCQINHSLPFKTLIYGHFGMFWDWKKPSNFSLKKQTQLFDIFFKKNYILAEMLLHGFQTELSVWIRFMKINSILPFSFQLCNQSLPRLDQMYHYIACIIF